jgi:beta-glucosidase
MNGKPREIHVEQSIAVTNVPDEADKKGLLHTQNLAKNELHELISCEYYRVWKLDLAGSFTMKQDFPFLLLSVLEGEGRIGELAIKKGDHFILPTGYGNVFLSGTMELILSTADCTK